MLYFTQGNVKISTKGKLQGTFAYFPGLRRPCLALAFCEKREARFRLWKLMLATPSLFLGGHQNCLQDPNDGQPIVVLYMARRELEPTDPSDSRRFAFFIAPPMEQTGRCGIQAHWRLQAEETCLERGRCTTASGMCSS